MNRRVLSHEAEPFDDDGGQLIDSTDMIDKPLFTRLWEQKANQRLVVFQDLHEIQKVEALLPFELYV